MKMTAIPIVNDALGTISKGLWRELEDLEISGKVETFQTTSLLRSARILRGVQENREDLQSYSNERPLANAGFKKNLKE